MSRFTCGLAVLVCAALAVWLTSYPVPAADPPAVVAPATDDEDDGAMDPLGPNAACYVCHLTFVGEEIASVHHAENIGCIKCHGLSAAHANDEHIGATPPDKVYKRADVDRACRECHAKHDVAAADVVKRFVERKLKKSPAPICTDCHGQHRIEAAAETLNP
jgi:hypothetical protein